MSAQFSIECTRCGWRRLLTRTHPPTVENERQDWRDAQRAATRRANGEGCPRCGDVNVVAVERNPYGHVVREAS